MSALKGEGSTEAAEKSVVAARAKKIGELPHVFTGSVEHAIAHIEESIQGKVDSGLFRWYAIKVFELEYRLCIRYIGGKANEVESGVRQGHSSQLFSNTCRNQDG